MTNYSQQLSTIPSPRRECPICYHVLPFDTGEHFYHSCCGQVICNGCVVGTQRARLKELGRIIEGTTPIEEQFRLIKKHGIKLCPYCRAASPTTDEEQLQRLYNRIENRNDRDYTIALFQLASCYEDGDYGLPQNLTKAEELYQEAYDLDDHDAALNLYFLYHNHYPDQQKKAREYLVRGEMLGNIGCILALANLALKSQNTEEYARLCVKAVRSGEDICSLMRCYKLKLLSKNDLVATMCANQKVKKEVKTEGRDFANRYEQFCELSLQQRIGMNNG